MDDDVAGGEKAAAVVIEGEAIPADITSDRVQPSRDDLVKTVTELGAQPVEAIVTENLPPRAFGRPLSLAWADEHNDLTVGHRSEQALNERCTEKARCPGHGDPPSGELVEYHDCVF
jgi:hypothetical protein